MELDYQCEGMLVFGEKRSSSLPSASIKVLKEFRGVDRRVMEHQLEVSPIALPRRDGRSFLNALGLSQEEIGRWPLLR